MIKEALIQFIALVMIVPLVTAVPAEPKLPKTEIKYMSAPVLTEGTFKPYMDAKCITDATSSAYREISKMKPDSNGLYRDGEYVAVALNRFYGHIGDKFKITLKTGINFKAIMADTKQDRHCDENFADANGGVIEFIVDTPSLPEEVRYSGSLEFLYPGAVEKIEREV